MGALFEPLFLVSSSETESGGRRGEGSSSPSSGIDYPSVLPVKGGGEEWLCS